MAAATVKTVAYLDEVATLSNDHPADTAATAAEGVGTTASRDDHVHAIGAGSVGPTLKLASGAIDFNGVPTTPPEPTAQMAGMQWMDGTALKVCTVSYSV